MKNKQVFTTEGKISTTFNDFFRALKEQSKQKRLISGTLEEEVLFDIDKKDIIIFEVDVDKLDFEVPNGKKRNLIIPSEKIFVEIPELYFDNKKEKVLLLGGFLIYHSKLFSEKFNEKIVVIQMQLEYTNTETGECYTTPLSLPYKKGIPTIEEEITEEMNWHHGDEKKEGFQLSNNIKTSIVKYVQKVCITTLYKIERKEYTKYKKWTPRGFIEKPIIYAHDVSRHKRHFWEDSGRFKIPGLTLKEREEKGYGTDEVVFRDGELRRDVPFRIIGEYLVGKIKKKREDNRRIKVAKGRVLRCEQKVYEILREIFPHKIITRHDRRTLKGLELDFNLPELRLGVEYDGEQHYDKELCEAVFKSNFDELVRRDRKKDKLCQRKKIKLLRIKYDEPLTKTHFKKKLNAMEVATS